MRLDNNDDIFELVEHMFENDVHIANAIKFSKKAVDDERPQRFKLARIRLKALAILLEDAPEMLTAPLAVATMLGRDFFDNEEAELLETQEEKVEKLIELYGEEAFMLIIQGYYLTPKYIPRHFYTGLRHKSDDYRAMYLALAISVIDTMHDTVTRRNAEMDPDGPGIKRMASPYVRHLTNVGFATRSVNARMGRRFERSKRRPLVNEALMDHQLQIQMKEFISLKTNLSSTIHELLIKVEYLENRVEVNTVCARAYKYLMVQNPYNIKTLMLMLLERPVLHFTPEAPSLLELFKKQKRTLVAPMESFLYFKEWMSGLDKTSEADIVKQYTKTQDIYDEVVNEIHNDQQKVSERESVDTAILLHLMEYFENCPYYDDQNEIQRFHSYIFYKMGEELTDAEASMRNMYEDVLETSGYQPPQPI